MPRLYDPQEDLAIGARIRARRLAKGLTQTMLADRIDITFQQMQKYEGGLNRLSVTAMKKIAAALEVKPCEICGCCDE